MVKYTGLEIAVVGMSCKFPEADTIEEFWENLKNGKNSISQFTEEEALKEDKESLVKQSSYVKANAYLKNKQYFDSEFFGYTPHEAELMDPQVRLYHECCWEALEDSGYTSKDPKLKIGVFSAGYPNIPWMLRASQNTNQNEFVDGFTSSHLIDATFLSSRISYKFDLKGPAIFVQTACSSSLVAIHEGCNSLLLGESNMVLVGGVNVRHYSKKGYVFQEGMIHSKDGTCRPFDAQSSGTVGGEGVGVVVLKRLKDAIRDKDNIHAIIKGTAINNDGSAKVGYTAPSVRGQVEVIKKAHSMARIDADTISYVETHGTATSLGDPIEIEALNTAFGKNNEKGCAIGSVKSNIGHLDAAAGVAGFIKTVLALKHRELPPSLHYTEQNPAISFSQGPFFVNNQLTKWGGSSDLLRAGVSSFGIGGTNAHVVLQEAPAKETFKQKRKNHLLPISAKTVSGFQGNVAKLKKFIEENQQINIADTAYTLQTGRERFKFRKAIVCENTTSVLKQLEDLSVMQPISSNYQEELQHVVFMFPGQGMQYVSMCADLYSSEETFREEINTCLELAKKYTTADLHSILFSNEASKKINQTEYAQPLLFFVEYALAKQLSKWGVTPDYMIGHSIGEYTAACLSGVFELEDAIRLVIKRGLLMSKASTGAMLSISSNSDRVNSYLKTYDTIDLAVVNSDSAVVVSGTIEDIDVFKGFLDDKGIQSKKLHTSHAFHSRMMDNVLNEFEEELKQVTIKSPKIPFISNVSGDFVNGHEVKEPSYWTKHLRGTVNFKQGVDTLLSQGDACFVEVGPGSVLSNYVNENEHKTDRHRTVNTVRHVKYTIDDQQYFLEKLGELWEFGIEIDWEQFYGEEKRCKISLPTYAFERKEYTTDFNFERLLSSTSSSNVDEFTEHSKELINTYNWKRSTLPNTAKELEGQKRNFLIFRGNEDFSQAIIETLKEKQQGVIEVKLGEQFKKVNEGLFEINISALDQVEQLWDALRNINFNANEIIYGLPLSEKYTSPDYDKIDKGLRENYLGISYISRALANYQPNAEVKITVLSNYLANIMPTDFVDPLKALVLSPAKIIPSEMNTLRCKVVDIPYPFGNDSEHSDYAEKVINEMFYKTDDALVGYRYAERWTRDITSLVTNEKTVSNTQLVDKGTYLIVGGTGGIGLSIAAEMSSRINGNFILVHRKDFPKKEVWSEWISTHGENNDIVKKIRKIQKIEHDGSTIELHQLDVANESGVKAFLEDKQKNNEQIKGLIWAAGEVDYGGIILNRSENDLIKYSTSKVHGVLLFEKYMEFSNLDFLALFSSIGNVIYQIKFGQVGYNAGNEFLESYSHYAKKQWGIHAFTINWCDWYDIGLTFNSIIEQDQIEDVDEINSRISHAISPDKGVDTFFRCLDSKETTFSIFPEKLEDEIQFQQNRLKEFQNAQSKSEAEKQTEIKVVDSIENAILNEYSNFFGKELKLTDNFFELGGDSLKAMNLVARINQLGLNLTINDIYQNPTIKELLDSALESGLETETINIPKVSSKEHYTVSSEQNRMFLLQELDVDSTLYNETEILWIIGELDTNKVEKAFTQIIERHESLRTSYLFDAGELKQKVSDDFDFQITLSKLSEHKTNEFVDSFITPFDLRDEKEPLLRVGLLEKSPTEHLLIMDSHHIVMDGASRFIIREEFNKLMNEESIEPLKLQYKDYAEWQNSEEQKALADKEKSFWLKEFSGEVEPLELPIDFTRPVQRNNEGDVIRFEIGQEETKKLKSIAAADGTTIYTVLVAVINVLLSKLSNQEDVVIGTPVAGRQHADLENLIGMFVNTLCLRNYPEGQKTFKEFLSEVKGKTLDCLQHQSYPFEELVTELKIARDTSRNPLFDVMFVYQNYEEAKNETEGLVFKPEQFNHTSSRFDMTLLAVDDADQLFLRLIFSTELFNKETVQRFVSYLKNIVTSIINDQEVLLSDIDILPIEEKQKIVQDFNDTQVNDVEKNVAELFVEQVAKYPDNIALIHDDEQITYLDLDRKANAIANRIHDKLSGSDHKIGLLFNHSIEMVACLLGVVKSGYAYVPLSAEDPDDRKQYILSDCGASLLLVQEEIYNQFEENTLIIEEEKIVAIGEINQEEKAPVDPLSINTNDLLYAIYTSGTTGKPKGVEIRHKGIVNYALWGIDYHNLTHEDVTLQLVSYHFDGFGSNFYQAILSGGAMITVPRELKLDVQHIVKQIDTKKVTNFAILPGLYNEILDEIKVQQLKNEIRFVVLAGEKSGLNLIQKSKKILPSISLENQYGPTETTIGSTHNLTLDIDSASNIGKPIRNTAIYILDNKSNILPIGVKGEIHIAGKGIAKGYINKSELTNEKFITNPFGTYEKMYKTGDVGRWLSDGTIEIEGRKDDQIKIRGFRVEPGEISNHITVHEHVSQSAVIIKEKSGQKYLAAYYISEIDISANELRDFLSQRVPDYMIPSYFIRMEKFPYTLNGKLDKRLMPEPAEDTSEYASAITPEEEILVEVWSKVLGAKNIGVLDNFFLIGGDSIKSIQISSRLRSLGYEVSVKDILTSRDIRTLATKITKTQKQSDQSTVVGEATLSPIQQWFFNNNPEEKHHFNQSVLLDFDSITEEEVKIIFEKIQEHHDVLRTVYKENTEEPTSCYLDTDESPVSLHVFDLRGAKDASAVMLSESRKIQSGINIHTGPLMHLGLFKMDKGSRLLIVIHHLAVDGVSWRILFEDIETLYQQIRSNQNLELPLKTDSFKTWTDNLRRYSKSDSMKMAKTYWNEEVQRQHSTLKRDHPNGENIFKHKAVEQFQLDQETTAKLLSDVHHPFGTQINDILLTAFLWTYSEFFNTDNVLIDLESHGRESLGLGENISRTIGWFTTFYPVFLSTGRWDVNQLNRTVKEVKEKLRKIPNKGIDYLIYKYFTENEVLLNNDAQISFNYLGQFDSDIENSSFTIGKEDKGDEISPNKQRDYDWDLTGIVTEGKLTMSIMYSSKQYNQDTIQAIINGLKTNLEKLITYCVDYGKKEFSPSDFIYKELSFNQLDDISERFDIQNIYQLSPMQEGMLFHYLMNPNSESYLGQMTFEIHGALDIEAVEESMNALINRHEVLRTLFLYEGYERPVQLVLKERKANVQYRDLLHEMSIQEDINREVENCKENQKHNNFDLSKDLLMRLVVLRTAEEKYTLIWNYHHILMDGWCSATILSEFRELYSKNRKGIKAQLPPVHSYYNYIEWLENRDKTSSKTYWQNYLKGYNHSASMPKANVTSTKEIAYDLAIEHILIEKSETNLLQQLTVEYGVTINTIIQFVWGMLLAKYNNVEDVVFGAVVSGRPTEIDGIENMIGLFINTIPVRIDYSNVEDLGEVLRTIQENALEKEEHQYHPLSDIQTYSSLGRELFDHIVIVENYPVLEDQETSASKNDFLVKNVEMLVQSNYDLSLVVVPNDEIEMKIEYNANVYDKATVQNILAHLNHLILQIILPSEVEVV